MFNGNGWFVLSGYLLSVFGVVLIGAILYGISPEGKTSSLVMGTVKVACLTVILSPILSFLSGKTKWKNFFENSSDFVITEDVSYIEYCSREERETAQKYLETIVKNRFSVETEIVIECDKENDRKVEKITVFSSNFNGKSGEICAYLTENYGVKAVAEVVKR